MSKYTGPIGNLLDRITGAIDMLGDGNLTPAELTSYLTNAVAGAVIGMILFAGGVLSVLYDLSGTDDLVKAQIESLL